MATQHEVNQQINRLVKDIYAMLRSNSLEHKVTSNQVEEFAILILFGIKPTWED